MLIFCRCKSRACGFSASALYLMQKVPPTRQQARRAACSIFFTTAEAFACPRRAELVQRRFYFAVLIKLRLSHRYFAPEISVTAATSQHRPMLISETAPMASAGAKAAST